MICIGIDPGPVSGCIAWIDNSEVGYVEIRHCTKKDLHTTLQDLRFGDDHVFALMEQVHAMPKQGIASTWRFGENFGQLEMALIAADIPHEFIVPGEWQREFGLKRKSKDETKSAKKKRHRQKAEELFPGIKITNINADALLIAEYCQRRNG